SPGQRAPACIRLPAHHAMLFLPTSKACITRAVIHLPHSLHPSIAGFSCWHLSLPPSVIAKILPKLGLLVFPVLPPMFNHMPTHYQNMLQTNALWRIL